MIDVETQIENDYLTKVYFHNSELQRLWAWELISKGLPNPNDFLMDYGSGDGKISAELSKLVPNGQVLGIELSQEMYQFSSKKFPSSFFPNLKFEKINSPLFNDFDCDTKFDKIYSFNVFHIASDPLQILENFKKHLQHNGKILLTFPLGNNSTFYYAARDIFSKYNLPSPWRRLASKEWFLKSENDMYQLLVKANYNIELLETIQTNNIFTDIEEISAWMLGTFAELWGIPPEYYSHFFKEVAERMVEKDLSLSSEDGSLNFKMSCLNVIAKK